MKRFVLATAILAALAVAPAAHAARGGGGGGGHGGFGGHGGGRGGWGGGWHGHGFHGHSRFFVGGSVFFDPFFYDPFYYPYYAPYSYPAYVYPPPADYGWSAPPEAPPEEEAEQAPSDAEDAARATYGLVQLHGVPDGASVDLDGRFWLTAKRLDERWLALPRGEHTISVRVRGAESVERRVDVREGKNHVVRFGPFPHATG